jgi:hypothetical protein
MVVLKEYEQGLDDTYLVCTKTPASLQRTVFAVFVFTVCHLKRDWSDIFEHVG